MGFRDKVKKIIPKVNLQDYYIMIVGGWKSGKTRAFKEIIELHYPENPEAGLLLAWEPGYQTWEMESVLPLHEESDPWGFFVESVVPDLIQEAKDGTNTKILGFDTIDVMVEQATAKVIEKVNKKYGKHFNSLQEISNAKVDNGYILLGEEINIPMRKLQNAGYGIFWLGWTKEKETELVDGMKYQSLEMSLSNTTRKIFEGQAHLICCLYPESKALDKDGEILEENKVNAKGKEIASKFHSTEMYMYFRPNSYINIAGGRFLNLPEKVPYSAENFLKVFEDAVKGQLKNNKNVEEIRVKELKDREEKVQINNLSKEDIKEETSENKDKSENKFTTIKEVIDTIQDKYHELEGKVDKKQLNKIVGKPSTYKTIEQAEEVLEDLNKVEIESKAS